VAALFGSDVSELTAYMGHDADAYHQSDQERSCRNAECDQLCHQITFSTKLRTIIEAEAKVPMAIPAVMRQLDRAGVGRNAFVFTTTVSPQTSP
jgi:hypothetical protein